MCLLNPEPREERPGIALVGLIIAALAIVAICAAQTSCTYVSTRGDGWVFLDVHPLRDSTRAAFAQTSPDGGGTWASLGHDVRPEGESATQSTIRNLAHLAFMGLALGGGATGNIPAAGVGVAGAELTR